VNVEQCQSILDEFFHDRKLYMLTQYDVNEKTGQVCFIRTYPV
jgi:hypothetical protein